MDTNEIIEKIKKLSKDDRINCADARKLAEEYQLEYRQVGKACDEAGIKINACELGCF